MSFNFLKEIVKKESFVKPEKNPHNLRYIEISW